MRRIIALSSIFLISPSFADNTQWATTVMAQQSAYQMLQGMTLRHADGESWESLFSSYLPTQLSSSCGYAERAHLTRAMPEKIMMAAKIAVGDQLKRQYLDLFSRPGTQLHMIDSSSDGDNGVWIRLRVVPSTEKDPWLNLFYRMSEEGTADLCDIGWNEEGVLKAIGQSTIRR